MLVLLAIVLAFLAQNLLTPSPYDLAGICAAAVLVAWVVFAQGRDGFSVQRVWIRDAFALVVVLVVAWQLLPAQIAALVVFVLAGIAFARGDAAPHDAQSVHASGAARTRWMPALLFVVVLLASAVLCVYDNEHIQPGLHGDEAESGLEARNIDSGRYASLIGVGWYDQPLLSFAVQAAGLRVFGNTVSGLRTTSALVSLLTLPLVFLLARKLFGARVAFITFVLMAFAHWFIAYARLGINYNQSTLLEVLAVLTFWQGWQTQQRRWFLLSGLTTGAGLYLYFASRLVPILLTVFAGIMLLREWRGAQGRRAWPWGITPAGWRSPTLRVQGVALWASVMLLVFAPMGLFFLDHAKEFNSRADFVFLFSDTQYYTREQKLQIYTGTTDIPAALAVQVYRYATLFNVGGDRSGQYGNQLSLLEYYSAAFFALGLLYALRRAREPRYMLLLLWIALTVLIGGVLTIEAPFSPRMVGLMPVPFMLAAVVLDRTWTTLNAQWRDMRADQGETAQSNGHTVARLRHDTPVPLAERLVLPAVAVILMAAIINNNYWSYFDHYIHSIDGWAQREPATAVARYAAQMAPDQTMYMLSAPELFIWHGTIRFLAPNLRGFDLLNPETELPVREPNTKWAAFVMLPNHTQWIEELEQLYPHGTLREWRRPSGELWFDIYEAPAEDITARR